MFNLKWKKSAAAAALSFAILAHAGPAQAASYTAKDNDTFWSLSKQFGIKLEQLMKANPNVDPLNIYQGLSLTVPDSAAPVKAKAAAAPAVSKTVAKDSVTVKGLVYNYTDVVQAKASVYTAAASENGWGPVDYYGNPLKLGTIAVDPKRIPMGSKVYITGYDHEGLPVGGMMAVATDMGSAIKGDRIDIFVPQSQEKAREFGYQYVKVFILSKS
ncbi:3D domain-containing protein [Paenibacillus nasutitermitis]|uniref:LysM domain-containing protein n=1 Tax=Paenibacillus nasutitermitis TaxID=1652958 RepID=A0A916Z5W0_9BACL|nr:3D domain-containing protein [Paenibacillus nasutitermitis]GGD75511.1 hypothetical protein GCM10010911_36850 [Paenibacillus nasutitermitis]